MFRKYQKRFSGFSSKKRKSQRDFCECRIIVLKEDDESENFTSDDKSFFEIYCMRFF